jgi:hypothetical protein
VLDDTVLRERNNQWLKNSSHRDENLGENNGSETVVPFLLYSAETLAAAG